ncbi:sigma-70 family RNA polymerase sigma factor [Enterococcus sp. LJL90]
MSEEELVEWLRLAKAGDSEAFGKLFDQYRPVVLNLEQQYYLRDLDHDDWLQEGRMIFFQTIFHFDDNRGTTIGQYFKVAMSNRIRSLLRKQQAYKRRGQYESLSLDADELRYRIAERYDTTPGAENYLLLREKLSGYEHLFSPLEEQVMGYFLQGFDLKQLPELLNVSQNCIRGAFDRGKKKLCQHLLSDNGEE